MYYGIRKREYAKLLVDEHEGSRYGHELRVISSDIFDVVISSKK